MDLNLKRIKQLNKVQIYKMIFPLISKFYDAYDYLDITSEEFSEIVLDEIEKSISEFDESVTYKKFIKNKLKKRFDRKVYNDLNNPEKVVIIINNFTKKRFTNLSNVNDCISYFSILDDFLKQYNYILEPDMIIKLIKNDNPLYLMTETIFKKYKNPILFGKAEKLFDNDTLVSFIEVYCMVNNIEIQEENNEDEFDIDKDNKYFERDILSTYLREIGSYKQLTTEQERDLLLKIKNGDENAKELFIQSNLKLVVNVAKKFQDRGMSLLDLVQEGNIGLMKAIEYFDLSRNLKFSTYAFAYIKGYINRAINEKGRAIRIPVHVLEKRNMYIKAINDLTIELNRTPSNEEIAKKMGVRVDTVNILQESQFDITSLNEKVSDDSDTEVKDLLVLNKNSLSYVEDDYDSVDLKDQVQDLLEKCNLSRQAVEVLIKRYGLDGNEPMTLEEIGQLYNVTRERIRQIETKALMIIRRSVYAKKLVIFTEDPDKSLENLEYFRQRYRETGDWSRSYNDEVNKKDKNKVEDSADMKKEKNAKSVENAPKIRCKTVYELMGDYPKEKVDEAIKQLSSFRYDILMKRHGGDLENPTFTELNKKEKNLYYAVIIPRLRKILLNSNVPVTHDDSIEAKDENLSDVKEVGEAVTVPNIKDNEAVIESSNNESIASKDDEQITTTPVSLPEVENQENRVEEVEESKTFSKEEYSSILKLLRTPTFEQMLKTLSIKEAIIISLKLGYVDDKYFSTESIAQFLGIDNQEVIETTKKVLMLYRDNINSFIDTAINAISDDNKLIMNKK